MKYYYHNMPLVDYCRKRDLHYTTVLHNIFVLVDKDVNLDIAISTAVDEQVKISILKKTKMALINECCTKKDTYSHEVTNALLKLGEKDLKLILRRTYDSCDYEYLIPEFASTIYNVHQKEQRILRTLKKHIRKP